MPPAWSGRHCARRVPGSVQEALVFATAALGFDTFVFGIVANDRRPIAESRTYVITDQAEAWIRIYDERAYLELDPRIELAGEPGHAFWEARQFDGTRGTGCFCANRPRTASSRAW